MRRLTATAPALPLRARPLLVVKGPEPVSDLEATRKVLGASDAVVSLGIDSGVFPRRVDDEATNFYALHALSPEALMESALEAAPEATDDMHGVEATVILASRPPRPVAPAEGEAPDDDLDVGPPSTTLIDVAPRFEDPSAPFVFAFVDAYAPEPEPEPAPRTVSMRAPAPTMVVPRDVEPAAPAAPRRVWPVVTLFVVTFAALACAFVLTTPRAPTAAPSAAPAASVKAAPPAMDLEAAPRAAAPKPVDEIDAPAPKNVAAPKIAPASPRPRPSVHASPRPTKIDVPDGSEELAKKQIDAL